MAITINGGGGSRRRGSSLGAMSEINVTPFVDVVLVLLIIFMLTAHVMEFGLEIDVPKIRYEAASAQDLPTISITRDGTTYLNEKAININDLKAEIPKRFPGSKAVYLKADKETIFEPIAQVLAELRAAGFQANVVTQPEDAAKSRKK